MAEDATKAAANAIYGPMKKVRFVALLLSVPLSPALHAALVLDFDTGSNTTDSLGEFGAGQTFYPEDSAGYSGESVLYLTGLSFWSGYFGGTGSATTYIAIYEGNPDTATFVGSSSNFLDTRSSVLGGGLELHWSFANLALDAGAEYWAVMSNSVTDDNATTIVGRSLNAYDDRNENPDVYRGTAIIRDRDPHESRSDLRFVATFEAVPEPSSALLCLFGCVSFLRRHRSNV